MVGKVSERVLLREGLERTDNGLKQTSWPEATPINQKNYYTEYMKRDDQLLALRSQTAKDRDHDAAAGDAAAPGGGGDGVDVSRVIVIHPGSQFLRIGFSTDVLPKTVPMCLASKYGRCEADELDALPRRQMDAAKMDQQHGEEWAKRYKRMSEDLKQDMRVNKRKVLPNSKELVANYNRRADPEIIPTHNDPLQVEWTDVTAVVAPAKAAAPPDGTDDTDTDDTDTDGAQPLNIVPKTTAKPAPPSTFFGATAQRVPDDSQPAFRLRWPIQHGWLNEDDYDSVSSLSSDLEATLTHAIQTELGLARLSACRQYSCVFVIPDLYDKAYVDLVLRLCMTWYEFKQVCFIQESYAATCGAGYSQGCVVDVGAQKTSVACVEDGLVVEDSRVNLKYGGYDVTEAFVKMLLYDHFPYQEINLRRRYDFLLAEELKQKHCTMSQADISVQLYQFHLRAPNQPTRKYQFKTYDEVLLAPMGFFEPAIFDNATKLRGRRKLMDRAYNAYDVDIPDDPVSAAQVAILALDRPSVLPTAGLGASFGAPDGVSTPGKERTQPFSFLSSRNGLGGLGELGATPSTSKAPSPAPETAGGSTPVPAPFVFGAGGGAASPAPSQPAQATQAATATATQSQTQTPLPGGLLPLDVLAMRTHKDVAAERDTVLPVAPLDIAIMTSIQNAAKGDERKLKDFLGSVMAVGGGAKIPHFTTTLEERLKARRPDLVDRILVSRSARDMDEQVVVWKGASVFAKLGTNDSWITPYEYAFLGPRILQHKVLWQW